jgi:hypothetical protein
LLQTIGPHLRACKAPALSRPQCSGPHTPALDAFLGLLKHDGVRHPGGMHEMAHLWLAK